MKNFNKDENNSFNRARIKTKHKSETTSSHDTQYDDTSLSLRSSTLVSDINILKEIFDDKIIN